MPVENKTLEVIKDLLENHKDRLIPIVNNFMLKNMKEASAKLQDLSSTISCLCAIHGLTYEEFLEAYSDPITNKKIMELIVKSLSTKL